MITDLDFKTIFPFQYYKKSNTNGCYQRIETVWQTDCVYRVWNQVVCSFVVSWFANKCQHSYFLCVFFTNRAFKTIPLTKRCLEKHYFEKTH